MWMLMADAAVDVVFSAMHMSRVEVVQEYAFHFKLHVPRMASGIYSFCRVEVIFGHHLDPFDSESDHSGNSSDEEVFDAGFLDGSIPGYFCWLVVWKAF